MSEFLGSRISLISKSDIRYVGTLHEINSEESTVSLENVCSFGTEGRRGRLNEEISPSDQMYEYIIFRGSDVKDLRIEEHPGMKETKQPRAMPDDPAIVGARTRAPPRNQHPSQDPGNFQYPYDPNNYYGAPPPPGPWGRGPGRDPMPGPGYGNVPYPPPSAWPSHGQGVPPDALRSWHHGAPGSGATGELGPGTQHPHQVHQGSSYQSPNHLQDLKTASKNHSPLAPPSRTNPAPPTETKSLAQVARQPSYAPSPPVESKPSAEEVEATAAGLSKKKVENQVAEAAISTPSAPRNTRVTPVMPLFPAAPKPFQLPATSGVGQTSVKTTVKAPAQSVEDATNAARAAVATAMAQLGNSGGNVMDHLTTKVHEMRVSAPRGISSPRGRGRGGRQGTQKIELPEIDFDFAQSNAKFNKQEIAKEAIAGSPITEHPIEASSRMIEDEMNEGNPAAAYNKSRSFFDNISSEAKDRLEKAGQKPGGREWRGEEQRKNMETFGQGSVDGGYRGYRGRGRGRGGRGRSVNRGGPRGPRAQLQTTAAHQ